VPPQYLYTALALGSPQPSVLGPLSSHDEKLYASSSQRVEEVTTPPAQPDTSFMTVGQSQLERAIYEIQHRSNVPQLDFTQHQLDNGYTISTRERVVKEVRLATS